MCLHVGVCFFLLFCMFRQSKGPKGFGVCGPRDTIARIAANKGTQSTKTNTWMFLLILGRFRLLLCVGGCSSETVLFSLLHTRSGSHHYTKSSMQTLCCGFRVAPGLAQHRGVGTGGTGSSSKHTRPVSQTSSSSAARHAAHHHQQQPHRLLLVPAQAAAIDTQVEEDFTSPDNFYAILGIPQNASQRDIKRAYKAMMKDFHPDLSGDEESTEFCILLNDIYEVCQCRRASAGWQPRIACAVTRCSIPYQCATASQLPCVQQQQLLLSLTGCCEHVVLSARRP